MGKGENGNQTDSFNSPAAADYGDWLAEYDALRGGAGINWLGLWTQVELTGCDAPLFLNHLTTNKIAGLQAGTGCETFLLNAKGHVLAHLAVYAGDSLLLETVPDQAEHLLAHLDFYLINEEVRIADRSRDRAELLLAGPDSPAILRLVAGDTFPVDALTTAWQHWDVVTGAARISVRWTDRVAGNGLAISCDCEAAPRLWNALMHAGARPCGRRAFEAARIEAGWPWFGRDISEENLAQEVGRDGQAISFDKGCYLGQEPVARIASRGHVNRKLVGVRFERDEVPPAGFELTADGQSVGRVTSASFSPTLGAPLALAYIRRELNEPGSKIESVVGPAEVVALPII